MIFIPYWIMNVKGVNALKFKKLRKVFLFIFTFIIFCPSICVFADDDDKTVIKILQSFSFKSQNPISNIGHQIGWGIVTGLHWLVQGIEGVVFNVNDTVGGFFTSDGVIKLEQKIFPLAIALFVLVILFIGILSMIKPRNFSSIAGNLAVGMVIAVGLPTLLSSAYSLTNQAITYLDSDSSGTMELLSDRILVDNITDNTIYDDEDFKSTTIKYKSCYDKPKADITKIADIDPTELVDPDNMKHPNVWKNKINTDKDGKQSLQGLGDGTFGFINIPIFSQHYYRWNINWFSIIFTLIITAFALILSGIKIARLLYELVVNQTMAQFLALLDIVTAQRLKKCLQMLLSTFVTLFSVFFMLQIYILGMSYISNVSNPFLRLICMVALAWAVIDGPNLFEQLFGVDAGIHSAVRTIYGMKAAGSMVAGGAALLGGRGAMDSLRAKGITGMAKAVAGKAGNIVGGASGAAAGFATGAYNNHKRYSAARNGSSGAGAVSRAAAGVSGAGSKSGSTSSGHTGNAKAEKAGNNNVNTTAGASSGGVSAANGSQGGNSTQAGETSPDKVNTPDLGGAEQNVQDGNSKNTPTTIGGYMRSGISKGFRNSGAYKNANHVYSLTRGSRTAKGDKKAPIKYGVHERMQNNSSLSHHEAVKQVKKEIKNEKKSGGTAKTWAEHEFNSEKNNMKSGEK